MILTPKENMFLVLIYSLVIFSIAIITILLIKYIKYQNRYKISFLIGLFMAFNILFFFDNLYTSLRFSELFGIIKTEHFYVYNEINYLIPFKIIFLFLNAMFVYFILSGHVEYIRRHEDKIKLMAKLKGKKEILLIDPDAGFLRKEKEVLQRGDYIIHVATRAKDSLDILREKDISLIIMEWTLPDLNGRELCSIIRKSPKTKDVKIVLLTFLTLNNVEERILESLKVNKYLRKPYDLDDLSHLVDELLI